MDLVFTLDMVVMWGQAIEFNFAKLLDTVEPTTTWIVAKGKLGESQLKIRIDDELEGTGKTLGDLEDGVGSIRVRLEGMVINVHRNGKVKVSGKVPVIVKDDDMLQVWIQEVQSKVSAKLDVNLHNTKVVCLNGRSKVNTCVKIEQKEGRGRKVKKIGKCRLSQNGKVEILGAKSVAEIVAELKKL